MSSAHEPPYTSTRVENAPMAEMVTHPLSVPPSTLHPIDSSAHALSDQDPTASGTMTQPPPPILNTLSILSSDRHPGPVGGARAVSLTHMLSGLQEEGTLAEVLQDQSNLQQGLNEIGLGDVSSNPESLRFQYQPEDQMLQHSSTSSKKKVKSVYREQDRFLPLHNVARTMRNAIPHNGKVSKDAKECMQECVSECISFITSEASDKCIAEKRKTITGDDILYAMATLGFDNYVEPLRLYLQKYRENTIAEKSGTNSATSKDSCASGFGGAESLTMIPPATASVPPPPTNS